MICAVESPIKNNQQQIEKRLQERSSIWDISLPISSKQDTKDFWQNLALLLRVVERGWYGLQSPSSRSTRQAQACLGHLTKKLHGLCKRAAVDIPFEIAGVEPTSTGQEHKYYRESCVVVGLNSCSGQQQQGRRHGETLQASWRWSVREC